MNFEVYRIVLSAPTGQSFSVQMDNDLKHASKATQELELQRIGMLCTRQSQSPDLNPSELHFTCWKAKLQQNTLGISKN